MIVLLLIWVLMIFVVPKLSSMVAQIIYPVKSEQVLNSELQMAKRNLDEKYIEKRRQLLKDMLLTKGLSNNDSDIFDRMGDVGVAGIFQQYDQNVVAIEQEYEKEYANTVKKLEQDYDIKKQTQTNIALFISRLSPVCCYLNVLSELSGTGISELLNFTDHAQRFQHQVENEIYSKCVIKRYYDQGGCYSTVEVKPGVDRRNINVPILTDYKHVNLAQALTIGWIDILCLLFFAVILFAASYVSFLRYDVR
jgi:ABC-type transport system involved in multi-copper enzyme maturation permease subunit